MPTDDLSVNSLSYLSSEQALADLANLITTLKHNMGLSSANKVIAFGGSYPGALAAWFRLKYPHIIHASIASSAPVLAKVDFYEYMQVVAESISSEDVGGSDECRENVKRGYHELEKMLKEGQEDKVGDTFDSCYSISDSKDQVSFLGNIGGVWQGIVQYNNQQWPNIEFVCSIMTANSNFSVYQNLTNLERLAVVNRIHLSENDTCDNHNYSSSILSLKNETVDPTQAVGDRQWIYQTCTQFGYYQTCEKERVGTPCVFSNRLDLQSNVDLCTEVFGLDVSLVHQRIDFTNVYYGGRHTKQTRILFVNGKIDPWHALSLTENPGHDQATIFIPGASHCQNMAASSDKETKAMKKAKEYIAKVLDEWL